MYVIPSLSAQICMDEAEQQSIVLGLLVVVFVWTEAQHSLYIRIDQNIQGLNITRSTFFISNCRFVRICRAGFTITLNKLKSKTNARPRGPQKIVIFKTLYFIRYNYEIYCTNNFQAYWHQSFRKHQFEKLLMTVLVQNYIKACQCKKYYFTIK